MLDGIPLRRPGRVVADSYLQVESVAKILLQLLFPQSIAIAVAAATVSQNKDLLGLGIGMRTDLLPPFADGVDSELRGVAGGSHADKALIAAGIIDAIGNADSLGLGRKIVIEYLDKLLAPTPSVLVETADEFTTLGVDANNRKVLRFIGLTLLADVAELTVPLFRVCCLVRSAFNVLAILSQREALCFEQTSHGRSTD